MAKGRTWRKRKQKLPRNGSMFGSQYVDLLKWMKSVDNSFKLPSLSPRVFPNTGRGLMTTKPLQAGNVLISVPAALIITTPMVLNGDVSTLIKRCKPLITAQAALSVFLLAERAKGSDSVWSRYISMLPLEFETVTYWETEAVNVLPPHASHLAQKCLKSFHKAFTTICECCSEACPPYLTDVLTCEKNFIWAWNAVNTRCVYFEVPTSPYIEESGKNCALIPYLDLLNHSADAKIKTHFNNTTNCFEIITMDNYKRYDQVFIKYGMHNNSDLLIEYGFTIPDNPCNFYEFSFDTIRDFSTSHNVGCIQQKEELLKKYNLTKELRYYPGDGGISWNLQSVLHILNMSWQELTCWQSCLSENEWPMNILEFSMDLISFIINKRQLEQEQMEPRILKLKCLGEVVKGLWQEEEDILIKMKEELFLLQVKSVI